MRGSLEPEAAPLSDPEWTGLPEILFDIIYLDNQERVGGGGASPEAPGLSVTRATTG
jgi:hypothetical protein